MTVRDQALAILEEVLERGGNSSHGLARARASGADRALLTELVLGTVRRRNALDTMLQAVCTRPIESLEPTVRTGLRLGAAQLMQLDRVPPHAAVMETVDAVKRASTPRRASFVNGVLRGLVRRRDDASLPRSGDGLPYLTQTLSLPAFLAERWSRRFGVETTRRMAEAALRPPRLSLRVVSQRTDVAGLRSRLEAQGVSVTSGRYLDSALVVDGVAARSSAIRDGLAMVQDEAAQIVAELIAAEPGMRVLDACAAPGGKTVAVADSIDDRGLVVAMDARLQRLTRLRENLDGCRLGSIRVVAGDASTPPFATAFDRVLVDAPCTATGTIRRHPEARYRVDQARLERSRERNLRIVRGVAELVRPGGRLVYATCSLEPEENDEVVERLLADRSDLVRVDARTCLPASCHQLVADDGVLRTQPADLEIDGFTAFILERSSAR